MGSGWIGVDLDGTLAEYTGWRGHTHIGPPVPAMVERVKGWLETGVRVKIFTARVFTDGSPSRDRESREAMQAIAVWSDRVFGRVLEVTNTKDYGMYELWDDRAVTVEQNTGRIIRHPRGEATP